MAPGHRRFLPYGRPTLENEDREAILEALQPDRLTQGPMVDRFENALREYCGARHAVVVSSGTAALHLAALAAGFRDGDRVAAPSNTFAAGVNCILYAGADPVFVEIDPANLNLDPDHLARLADEQAAAGWRGVIPVHFAGLPAPMERIDAIASRLGLTVIEDGCHAIGSGYRDEAGRWWKVGSCAHSEMTVFSFHPVKTITSAEGGAILTNSEETAERLRDLRTHGIVKDRARLGRYEGPWYYEMQALGFNYRISDLHCALGLAQLKRLDAWVRRRAELAALYREILGGEERVRMVEEPETVRPAWHLFVVQVPERRRVFEALRAADIGVQVHYIPVHLQPFYRERYGTGRGMLPATEKYYDGAISLPLYASMKEEDVVRVAGELRKALG